MENSGTLFASNNQTNHLDRNTDDDIDSRFSNSFWGKEDIGVEVLITKMNLSKHSLSQLKEYVGARIHVEEDYAKKLIKLNRTFKVDIKESCFKLDKSLTMFYSSLNDLSKLHYEFSSNLKTNILGLLDSFYNDYKTKLKYNVESIDSLKKIKCAKYSMLEKTKTKFFSMKKKCIGLNDVMHTLYGKEYEKAQHKLEKTANLSIEINNLTKEIEQININWENEWKSSCEVFQSIEEERIDLTKKVLWEMTNMESSMCVSKDELNEKIRVSLEDVVKQAETNNFIQQNKTGSYPELLVNDVSSTRFSVAEFMYNTTPSPNHNVHSNDSNSNSNLNSEKSKRMSASDFIKKAINKSQEKFKAKTTNMNSNNSSNSVQTTNSEPETNKKANANKIYLNTKNNSSSNNSKTSQPILSSVSELASQLEEGSKHNSIYSAESSLNSIENNKIVKVNPDSKDVIAGKRMSLKASNSNNNNNLEENTFYVKVLFAYAKEEEQEMTIVPDQLIRVVKIYEDGWWDGEIVDFESGKVLDRGLFPSNFTARIE